MTRSNLAEDFSAEAKLAGLMGPRKFGVVSDTSPPAIGLPSLRAEDLHLGNTAANIPIGLSLPKLIAGRLLIQGNSGAGKSMLLRRLFEQAFGRVQQLLVDLDGEFSTLTDHFDVAVLTAADVLRIGARTFALHLREHRYSAILDMSDATAEDRMRLVTDLCNGLIDAPEDHWHPLLVEIDEAQIVAPRQDMGDVDPAMRKQTVAALADLMGRGRKRGIAGVIATQRLGETSISISSKATNIICGRTIFDRDLERASSTLGFTVGQGRALRTLSDGEFICLGPAIAGPKRVRFRTGPVKSRHKGSAPDISVLPRMTAADSLALLKQVPAAAATEAPAPTETRQRDKPGRRGRDWRQEEDAIIRAGYAAGEPIVQIGGRLAAIGFSTSTSNISMRAHSLGLISAKAAVAWCDREDEIVRDAYERDVRIHDITALLAEEGFVRGRVAIQMRAIGLGITRDRVNYWTPREIEIALAGLKAGKYHGTIRDELAAEGFHRGPTAMHKFAQKHRFIRKKEDWSVDQLETLRTCYAKGKGPKEVVKLTGRTYQSIVSKASILGLAVNREYTIAQRKLMEKMHGDGKSLVMIAEALDRPYPNVAAEASRMGLAFNRKAALAAKSKKFDGRKASWTPERKAAQARRMRKRWRRKS